jgi:DNA-binding transcriptional LysR family regulator
VRVSIDERVSSEIVRALREGSADVGVLWDHSDLGGLHAVPYRSDHLDVVAHPGHALAHRRRLRFAETLGHDAVSVAPDDGGTFGATGCRPTTAGRFEEMRT